MLCVPLPPFPKLKPKDHAADIVNITRNLADKTYEEDMCRANISPYLRPVFVLDVLLKLKGSKKENARGPPSPFPFPENV